jgi:hypothetical protein
MSLTRLVGGNLCPFNGRIRRRLNMLARFKLDDEDGGGGGCGCGGGEGGVCGGGSD